jgi:hypothetical protein
VISEAFGPFWEGKFLKPNQFIIFAKQAFEKKMF